MHFAKLSTASFLVARRPSGGVTEFVRLKSERPSREQRALDARSLQS